jgi:hypothetical protein
MHIKGSEFKRTNRIDVAQDDHQFRDVHTAMNILIS